MTTKETEYLVQDLVNGAEDRGTFVGELARIALSDDDAETRERHVREALARFEANAAVFAQGVAS